LLGPVVATGVDEGSCTGLTQAGVDEAHAYAPEAASTVLEIALRSEIKRSEYFNKLVGGDGVAAHANTVWILEPALKVESQ
jgi:hypothetical protein